MKTLYACLGGIWWEYECGNGRLYCPVRWLHGWFVRHLPMSLGNHPKLSHFAQAVLGMSRKWRLFLSSVRFVALPCRVALAYFGCKDLLRTALPLLTSFAHFFEREWRWFFPRSVGAHCHILILRTVPTQDVTCRSPMQSFKLLSGFSWKEVLVFWTSFP